MNTSTFATAPVIEYQLYFMMLTYRLRHGERVLEPQSLKTFADISPELLHRKMEKDKRVFQACGTQTMNSEEISHWIAATWQKIKTLYDDAGQNHAETLLASVALVVIAEDVADISFDLTVRDEQARALGLMSFTDSEVLFELKDQADTIKSPIKFSSFQGDLQKPLKQPRLIERWQLDFSDTTCFKPIQYEENQNHPMFAMYAVATGRLSDEMSAKVQNLLWQAHGKAEGRCALMFLMTHLLMCQWQSNHILAAATIWQEELDKQNDRYRSYSDTNLGQLKINELQKQLLSMRTQEAETKYMLSRLQRAMQTLNINLYNLKNSMEFIAYVAPQNDLVVDWYLDEKTAILEREFNYHLQLLEDRKYYIQGSLTHLEASGLRWQVALEKHHSNFNRKITILGYIITAITLNAALVQFGGIFQTYCQSNQCSRWQFLQSWDVWLAPISGLLLSPAFFMICLLLSFLVVGWLICYKS